MTAMYDSEGGRYVAHDEEPGGLVEPEPAIWVDMHEAVTGQQGDKN